MKILGLLNSPWMIDQGSLTEITREYVNHMQGEKVDFKAFMSERDKERPPYQVQGSTAIIPLKGIMTPGVSFFSFFFNGASTKNVQKNIQAALDNGEIDKIIIDVNSGGGSVEGAFELADFIAEAATQKEVIAFSDGTIASAAYLAVSGVSKIFITGKSNQIGSIGVISRVVEYSKMDEMAGLNVEEFVTGKFKNTGSSDKPITDDDREEIQSRVNAVYAPMVADIAKRRGLEPEKIVEMQARVFIGAEAIDNGLVDGVATIDELINNLSGVTETFNQKAIMDKAELKAKHPKLLEEIETDAYSRGVDAGAKDGQSLGAEAERKRIEGIREACFSGQEDLAAEMIADGKTTPGEAAIRFNAAEKQVRIAAGKQIDAGMPKPVASPEPKAKDPEPKTKVPKTPEQEFEASEELQAEFQDFETYKAYLDANEKGQVRVFQGRDE
jgi:signal peptide peptidase SppA